RLRPGAGTRIREAAGDPGGDGPSRRRVSQRSSGLRGRGRGRVGAGRYDRVGPMIRIVFGALLAVSLVSLAWVAVRSFRRTRRLRRGQVARSRPTGRTRRASRTT